MKTALVCIHGTYGALQEGQANGKEAGALDRKTRTRYQAQSNFEWRKRRRPTMMMAERTVGGALLKRAVLLLATAVVVAVMAEAGPTLAV